MRRWRFPKHDCSEGDVGNFSNHNHPEGDVGNFSNHNHPEGDVGQHRLRDDHKTFHANIVTIGDNTNYRIREMIDDVWF